MFTDHGLKRFVAALAKEVPLRARFHGGGWTSQDFYCDLGYPLTDDPDPANYNRGSNVMSWRFTVPKGFMFPCPATEYSLVDDTGAQVFKRPLPHQFSTYPTQSSILYVNILMGNR